MMWDLPAQEEWSSSWFMPKLPEGEGERGRGCSLQASHLLARTPAPCAHLDHSAVTQRRTGEACFPAILRA